MKGTRIGDRPRLAEDGQVTHASRRVGEHSMDAKCPNNRATKAVAERGYQAQQRTVGRANDDDDVIVSPEVRAEVMDAPVVEGLGESAQREHEAAVADCAGRWLGAGLR